MTKTIPNLYLASDRLAGGAVCFSIIPAAECCCAHWDAPRARQRRVSLQNGTNRTDARKPSGLDKRWVICISRAINPQIAYPFCCIRFKRTQLISLLWSLCHDLAPLRLMRSAHETGLMEESRYRTGSWRLCKDFDVCSIKVLFRFVFNQ